MVLLCYFSDMLEEEKIELKSMNFRMPPELHRTLKGLAYVTGRSLNSIVLEILVDGLGEWIKINIVENVEDEASYALFINKETIKKIDKTIESIKENIENPKKGD